MPLGKILGVKGVFFQSHCLSCGKQEPCLRFLEGIFLQEVGQHTEKGPVVLAETLVSLVPTSLDLQRCTRHRLNPNNCTLMPLTMFFCDSIHLCILVTLIITIIGINNKKIYQQIWKIIEFSIGLPFRKLHWVSKVLDAFSTLYEAEGAAHTLGIAPASSLNVSLYFCSHSYMKDLLAVRLPECI